MFVWGTKKTGQKASEITPSEHTKSESGRLDIPYQPLRVKGKV
jgi:hypothetical protein